MDPLTATTFYRGGEAGVAVRTSSMIRSVLRDDELSASNWSGKPILVRLWWGPVVTVNPGDLVHHFRTPRGIVAECVTTPRPTEPAP